MITLNTELCSGCRRCEVNCSFFHTGRVGRSSARVRVVKLEDQGLDFPVFCQQCQERYCRRCPESAITIGPQGQVIISPTLCKACGTCETRCPIGALELFEEIPYVCDLCGGDPRCVKACTMGAIGYVPDCTAAVSLKALKQGSRGLTTEQKRVRFAQGRFRDLRDRWTSGRRS